MEGSPTVSCPPHVMDTSFLQLVLGPLLRTVLENSQFFNLQGHSYSSEDSLLASHHLIGCSSRRGGASQGVPTSAQHPVRWPTWETLGDGKMVPGRVQTRGQVPPRYCNS